MKELLSTFAMVWRGGGIILKMIDSSRSLSNPSAGYSFDDERIRNFQQNYVVNRATHFAKHALESFCLANGAWKTIKYKSTSGIRLGYTFLHKANYDLVGNEQTLLHVIIGFSTKLCASLASRTKHVTRRYLWNSKLCAQTLRLRPFTSTRRTNENKIFHTDLRP
jgi:hypothetical protein